MTPLIVAGLVALAVALVVAAIVVLRRRRSRAPGAGDGATAVGDAADRVIGRLADRAAGAADVPAPSLRDRLSRARTALTGPLTSALERTSVSEEAWTEVTEALIRADVGLATSSEIVDSARARTGAAGDDPAAAKAALQAELRERLGGFDRSLARRGDGERPSVWLFVGVNGTGKTTTIGKLAKREADAGSRVVLAAGDTFRAAASDQLAMWAERSSAHIVRGAAGADPASVVYDAVESAAARGADLVLADTAGRFHTEQNLMAELQKVRRVADSGSGVVAETLLVLDATTGQNGLAQAQQFTEAVDVTGVVLTKLDGSAKGGIVVAVQAELGVPVKLVGVGEGIADLVPFDTSEFVDALFA
ncbi:MAG: signal recognition particle-docking protein FtsY [Acidimicrobiaceae bacterium]|nr:signal recognition particle-docking protein FtsY [Acidimicrobiaceae bacterium]MYH78676.1 signal recognition particle-docking protein FtsY [Acidimicrobiaceae bacterium]MYK77624.1 signal recognition particle-docking protein FtsY [Acidimicrobiaceae bacterium]